MASSDNRLHRLKKLIFEVFSLLLLLLAAAKIIAVELKGLIGFFNR